ncbi:MAG: alpha/beta hydrolase [Gemmatimonadota bacterium]
MTELLQGVPVSGGKLEYETRGDGEPVLLIHGSHFAASYLPLMVEAGLANYQLIRYHRRGFAGSAPHGEAFSIEQQAADALAVLRHLNVSRAHLAGHSYGGATALQLALDAPDVVGSLALLEPALLMVPRAKTFFQECVSPAVEKYQSGDPVGAVDVFGRGIGGPEWKAQVARTVPGGPEQAVNDARTFFEIELPALGEWAFDAHKATQIAQPILLVLGSESDPMFEEIGELVHSWFPQTEDHLVPGTNHLLQMQDPRSVAEGISAFLSRHPL